MRTPLPPTAPFIPQCHLLDLNFHFPKPYAPMSLTGSGFVFSQPPYTPLSVIYWIWIGMTPTPYTLRNFALAPHPPIPQGPGGQYQIVAMLGHRG